MALHSCNYLKQSKNMYARRILIYSSCRQNVIYVLHKCLSPWMSKNGDLSRLSYSRETLSLHVFKTIDNRTFVFNATFDLKSTFLRSNKKIWATVGIRTTFYFKQKWNGNVVLSKVAKYNPKVYLLVTLEYKIQHVTIK